MGKSGRATRGLQAQFFLTFDLHDASVVDDDFNGAIADAGQGLKNSFAGQLEFGLADRLSLPIGHGCIPELSGFTFALGNTIAELYMVKKNKKLLFNIIKEYK